MTLTLNRANWHELCQQAPQPENLLLNDFEWLTGVPPYLGRGYICGMELLPGVWLSFTDQEFHHDWMLQAPAHDHLIQICIWLSGFIYFDAVHPNLGGTCGYFSGSGISPAYVEKHRKEQHQKIVSIQMLPELLESFLADGQCSSDTLNQLVKEEEWKVSFYPTVTAKMRSLAQQMWNAPYCGAAKRMYLQGKVFELLAMQLDWVASNQGQSHVSPGLKPGTIDRLHHAKEILSMRLENPPSLVELGQQVGLSDRTLRRGFRELFGTTMVGYLTNQRMHQAQQLLRGGHCTVAEVANQVGYTHLGHFAAAFKKQFGVNPNQYLMKSRMPDLDSRCATQDCFTIEETCDRSSTYGYAIGTSHDDESVARK
jgi:AraC-like DNA-binding protein